MINVANTITVGRVFLALATLYLLWLPGDAMRWIAFGLTVLVMWGDGLDGYFARKLNQTSKIGAMLDIVGDRAVEMAYWIAFASLSWIPAWVPLLYLIRGTFVDAIRQVASDKGYTAFGEKTMMATPVGKFLVASNFSRFSYAVAKAAAFCLVIAAHISNLETTSVPQIAMFLVYFSCVFCVIRGLPVLIEGKSLLKA
ncbi:MAG: CDP-alcohol phosphatidyltransferase family protein [Candidatus Obscuribacterales bacterium]|nr:CDP-alcohol phosphatidyltransferase family protein [Candidatus Obscuribacterales bacterium]